MTVEQAQPDHRALASSRAGRLVSRPRSWSISPPDRRVAAPAPFRGRPETARASDTAHRNSRRRRTFHRRTAAFLRHRGRSRYGVRCCPARRGSASARRCPTRPRARPAGSFSASLPVKLPGPQAISSNLGRARQAQSFRRAALLGARGDAAGDVERHRAPQPSYTVATSGLFIATCASVGVSLATDSPSTSRKPCRRLAWRSSKCTGRLQRILGAASSE